MSKPSKPKPHAKKEKRGHYLLRLFMAGNGPNSQKALINLRSLCQEHLKGRCTIETVDVVKNFEAAVSHNILITPALILVKPGPTVMILGTLSDRPKVLLALRLSGGGGLMNESRPTYKQLEKRLAVAEPIVEALKRLEVDAVVGKEKLTFLLLKEVGEELQHSEAAFRAMFSLSGVGMAQADTPAFRFTRVNQTLCEMTGYSAEELTTKTFITHLLGDLLVVRLKGVLTDAEQHLVKTLHADKARDLLKQVRIQLIETARPIMEAMIQDITGVKVKSLHHDISTVTGEEVVLFTLVEPPHFRETKKRV